MPAIIQAIIDIVSALTSVIPYIIQLINAIKGQPTTVKAQAMSKAVDAAKLHCDGVACAPEVKSVE